MLCISAIAAILGYGFGEALVVMLLALAEPWLPVTLAWSWSIGAVLLALGIGPGLALIGGSNPLMALVGVKPLAMLRGDAIPALNRWRQGAVFALMLVAAWGLCWWQGGDALIALWIVLILLAVAGIVMGLGKLSLLIAAQTIGGAAPHLMIVARQWRRRPDQLALLAAIGLPVLLMTALALHRSSLLSELDRPPADDAPNLFAINITEAQRGEVASWLSERQDISADFAPMIRARLTAINGEELRPITDRIDDPEVLRRERMLHREQRLSWRHELGPDEVIREGEWLDSDAPYDQAELSIEKEFAEAVDLSIGDTVTLHVQGLPIDLPITSVREVDWRNARPNFFMLITPSALAGAPQEWIAAIQAPHDDRSNIQAALSAEFTSVSVFDIGGMLQRVRVMLAAALSAVSWLAGMGLLVGILVLTAILLVSLRQRRADAALLHILGTNRRRSWLMQSYELSGQLLAACIPAMLIAVAIMAWVLPTFFNIPMSVPWLPLIVVLGLLVIVAFMVAAWLVWPLNRSGTADALREP